VNREKKILFIYWILYYVLISFVEAGQQQYYAESFLSNLISLPVKFVFVFLTVEPLMNQFFLRKRTTTFIALYFLLLILFAIILRFVDNYLILEFVLTHWTKQPILEAPALLYNAIKLQFVACIPFIVKLFSSWIETEKRSGEQRRRQAESELLFLRNQFHPHFLFNSLNTLYSKILTSPSQASEIVLKICSLLRFSLYEVNRSPIELSKEIEYLTHYIDLQKLRFGDRINISFTTFGNFNYGKVEPFLILPFIENSFKYCQPDKDGQSWVTVQLSVEKGNLVVQIDNSAGNKIDSETISSGGIGQANVKRRLAMLYPETHQLKCEDSDENYYVYLKFPVAS
jgi:sensor histidine kinase YesM